METHQKPKHRLIFLDFDGVLNSYRTVWAAPEKENGWYPDHLDTVSIGLVRKLCELTGAKVVISSTWRDHFNKEELIEILGKKGWPNAPIIGMTRSTMSYRFRGNEVGEWMTDFVKSGEEVESWVILDDIQQFHTDENIQGGYFQNQPLVKTDDRDGMTLDNFFAALNYLDPQNQKLHQLQALLYK